MSLREQQSLRDKLHRIANAIQQKDGIRALQLRHIAERVGALEREHALVSNVAGKAFAELHSLIPQHQVAP